MAIYNKQQKNQPIQMNKIIKTALLNTFKDINIDALLQVIEATGNSIVATEILLGIYEQPEILEKSKDTSSEQNRTFISYDPIKDIVTYSYNEIKSKSGYVLKDTENPKVTDFIEHKNYYESDIAKELNLTIEEFKAKYIKVVVIINFDDTIRYSSSSLSNWNN